MKKKLMLILFGLFCLGRTRCPIYSENSPFLICPTGKFGVGYEDMSVVNTHICPDGFYEPTVNEEDFRSDNPRRCHEINVRLYYPSQGKRQLGDIYYAPQISRLTGFYAQTLNLSQKDMQNLASLHNVKTYTVKADRVSLEKKFPLIIFMPGAGSPAQWYMNIIAELVSHG
jgi:hypothetical protein